MKYEKGRSSGPGGLPTDIDNTFILIQLLEQRMARNLDDSFSGQ